MHDSIQSLNENINDERPAFLEFIQFWANHNVTKPIKGFEQKQSTDGHPLSKKELLDLTHVQVVHAADYFYSRGKPVDEILDILTRFVN